MKSLLVYLFAFCGISQGIPNTLSETCTTCAFFAHNATYQRCLQNGTIHLTFDDGPFPNNTNPVLDVLKANNIPVTFFINGANYPPGFDHPEVRATLRRAIDEGHRVEHHTWTHQSLISETTDSIHYQMNTLSDKIEEAYGFRPTLMRPPFGQFNNTVYDVVAGDLGYKFILWNLCPCDWYGSIETSMDVYRRNLEGTDPSKTPGFIALHHDPITISVELTRQVIAYVKTTGYRFVDMKECLGF